MENLTEFMRDKQKVPVTRYPYKSIPLISILFAGKGGFLGQGKSILRRVPLGSETSRREKKNLKCHFVDDVFSTENSHSLHTAASSLPTTALVWL